MNRLSVDDQVLDANLTGFSFLNASPEAFSLAYPTTPSGHPIWQIPTPALVVNPRKAVANYQAIQRAFPDAIVGYTVKSNPNPMLLDSIARLEGSWFEVASRAEIEMLANVGVRGDRIFYSNPIKQMTHIQTAVARGVRLFAFDSEAEIDKLAAFGLPLEVYVRMTVPHTGALWPLTHKFGVETQKAVELMKLARARGLKPVGLSFHVGSQCMRPETWADALRAVAPAWAGAREAGIELDLIDLGGGFPAPYTGPVAQPQDVAQAVYRVLGECVPGAQRVLLEPGRGVSATTTDMVLEVTGVAERPDGQTWLYLDGGVFSGLYEIPDGIRPAVRPIVSEPRRLCMTTYRLAGPTCDSVDTLFEMRSPMELKVGDRLIMKNCGSYVYAVGSPFNGFPLPEVYDASEWTLNMDDFPGIC
jgi:ornithine decarboxylase